MESTNCNNCNKRFASVSNLNKHLRENKFCSKINDDVSLNKECMWCKGNYDNIKKHLKNCKADKDLIHQQIIKEKDLEIFLLREQMEKETKNFKKQISDLQDKLFNLASKSTTTVNTTTYNTILNCDKPLVLDKDYIQKKLIECCGIMYLIKGGEGICDWFLEFICTNEYGNLCIECVDKNRKRFKFEDINEKINEISGREIVDLIKSCLPTFKKSFHYQSFEQHVTELCMRTYHPEEVHFKRKEYFDAIINMYNDFVNRLVDKTHKDSFTSLLKLNKEREEEERYY